MRISSADWFKAGVARQRVDPISLGIAPSCVYEGACTILSKLLLLAGVARQRADPISLGISPRACTILSKLLLLLLLLRSRSSSHTPFLVGAHTPTVILRFARWCPDASSDTRTSQKGSGVQSPRQRPSVHENSCPSLPVFSISSSRCDRGGVLRRPWSGAQVWSGSPVRYASGYVRPNERTAHQVRGVSACRRPARARCDPKGSRYQEEDARRFSHCTA